jgi:DNA-binding transcriptional ArsR family regulator
MQEANQQFAALGDPTRRAIFERLLTKPLPVGTLAKAFPISRPAVSQHLRVLKEAKLVAHERSGTQHIYRVDIQGLMTLRKYLDAMWAEALVDFKAIAESSYEAGKKEKR